MPARLIPQEERRRVEDRGFSTPCWIWIGARNRYGYGMVRRDGRGMAAHRAAYIEEFGPLPKDVHVHHLCRQRDCINLAHLEAVPQVEHIRHHRTLTWPEVEQIRARWDGKTVTYKDLAEEFGVHRSCIRKVVKHKTWRKPDAEAQI